MVQSQTEKKSKCLMGEPGMLVHVHKEIVVERFQKSYLKLSVNRLLQTKFTAFI